MKLLLVNDDGFWAPGMAALKESVKDHGDITIIAPHQERSATSQAITVHHPLRLTEVNGDYVLDGTPADCVKMALQGLGLKPDYVLSGINLGSNLGTDVLYSGTVAAALEAVLLGTPAVAFSLAGSAEFMPTATKIVQELLFEEPGILTTRDLIRPREYSSISARIPEVEATTGWEDTPFRPKAKRLISTWLRWSKAMYP